MKKINLDGLGSGEKKEIELGDSISNLMKHDAYKRVRGALRQIRWG